MRNPLPPRKKAKKTVYTLKVESHLEKVESVFFTPNHARKIQYPGQSAFSPVLPLGFGCPMAGCTSAATTRLGLGVCRPEAHERLGPPARCPFTVSILGGGFPY